MIKLENRTKNTLIITDERNEFCAFYLTNLGHKVFVT
jgi:hypothetical protein